jgi:hypothetical protein
MGLSLSLVTYVKLADRDSFSAYSFKMATTTIWLACITHISTMLTLSEDPFMLIIWRVVAIVLLFFLIAPILVISTEVPAQNNENIGLKAYRSSNRV